MRYKSFSEMCRNLHGNWFPDFIFCTRKSESAANLTKGLDRGNYFFGRRKMADCFFSTCTPADIRLFIEKRIPDENQITVKHPGWPSAGNSPN